MSVKTVKKRLNEAGLLSRRPAKGPLLETRHRIERLQFAKNLENWSEVDWSHVLFTEESRFCLKPDDGKVRVWRRRNLRYHHQWNILPRTAFGGGSVMVWTGISLGAPTELHIVEN